MAKKKTAENIEEQDKVEQTAKTPEPKTSEQSSKKGDKGKNNHSKTNEENDTGKQAEKEKKEEQKPTVPEEQYNEMRDKYLRLSAEFDNYRKRTLKEKADLLKNASEEVLKDLLPVIDDLDRALKAIETATEIDAVKEGLSLIVNKFKGFLTAKGVKEIEAIGLELDTDRHEAVTKIPVTDESQKGKIVDVIQKGYLLNDKVIRFSKVVIGE